MLSNFAPTIYKKEPKSHQWPAASRVVITTGLAVWRLAEANSSDASGQQVGRPARAKSRSAESYQVFKSVRIGPLQSVPPVRTSARFTSYILPALTLLVRRGIYSSKRCGISRDCFQLLRPSKSFMGEIKAHVTFTVDKTQHRKHIVFNLFFHKKVNTYASVYSFFIC